MTKKHLFITAIALLTGLCGQAQTPAAASSSVTVASTFVSQYMLRGVRLGGASFQPTIEYTSGALTLGLWNNFPIQSKVPGQSDPELDPYGSYTIEITKDLTLQPGFILYMYPRAEERNGFYRHTFEPSIALNYTVEGVKFTPKYYHDMVLKQSLLELSIAYSYPLKDLGTELAFLVQGGTFKGTSVLENSAPATKNWGNYWLTGVTMPFQLTKASRLSLGWAYTEGDKNYFKQGSSPKVENAGAVGRGVATVSYSYSF